MLFINNFLKFYDSHGYQGHLAWLFDLLCGFLFGQLFSLNDSFYGLEIWLSSSFGALIGHFIYAYMVSLLINLPSLLIVGESLGDLFIKREFRTTLNPFERLYSLGFYTSRFFVGASKKIDNLWMRTSAQSEYTRTIGPIEKCIFVILFLLILFSFDLKHLRYSGTIIRSDSLDITFYQRSRLDADGTSVASDRFQFSNYLENEFLKYWILYPKVESVRKKESTYVNGNVSFFSKINDDSYIFLEKEHQIDWAKLLMSFQRDLDEKFVKDLNSDGDHFLLSSRESLSDALVKILSAGEGHLSYILSYGDSVTYSGLRDQFLKILPLREVSSYSLHKVGDHLFVFLKGKYKHMDRFAFFPLTQKKANVYTLTWSQNIDEKQVDFFMSKFFKNLKWNFDIMTHNSAIEPSFSAFSYIDSIKSKKLEESKQKLLEEFLLSKSVSSLDELKKLDLNENLTQLKNEVSKVDKLVKIKKKNFSPNFIASWNTLINKSLSEERH